MCEEPFSPASTLFGARGGRLDIEKELALTSCILSSKSSSSMPCQLDSELKWLSPCATSSQTIFHPPPRMPEVNRIRCSEIRIIDTSGTDGDFWIETHRLHRLISNNGSPYNTCILRSGRRSNLDHRPMQASTSRSVTVTVALARFLSIRSPIRTKPALARSIHFRPLPTSSSARRSSIASPSRTFFSLPDISKLAGLNSSAESNDPSGVETDGEQQRFHARKILPYVTS